MTEYVCVVGLGNIGLPVAKHIAQHYPVKGYDIDQHAVTRALGDGINASTQLPNDDIYVVTVNTWFTNGQPDMSAIEDCCKTIARTKATALVCFEATLSVGTARAMSQKYGLTSVAVCPHRWWQKDEKNHGVVQQRVLGTLNSLSATQARAFYSTLGIPVIPVSSLEIAELTKIVENANTYFQIGFAQEVKMICDANGINFDELRHACNTKWNVELYEARDGIGGECLPKDIQYLIDFGQNQTPLLTATIQANHRYQHYVQTRE